MGKPGRPSKFTADRKKRVIEATRVGSTREIASAYAGIPLRTLQSWMSRGRRDQDQESDFAEFVRDVDQAESQSAIKSLALIQNAAMEGSWQAAAWMLERRHGYRREMSLSVSVEADSEILSVEELRKEIEDADRVISPMIDGPVVDLDD